MLLVRGVVLPVLAAMPPKPKVSASGDIGHDITFEVRPAKKGSPTVHVNVAGTRLPPFDIDVEFDYEVFCFGIVHAMISTISQPARQVARTPRCTCLPPGS